MIFMEERGGCLFFIVEGNKNDFLFSSVETRFIRVFILDNYGGEDIRIQGIGFFGLDTRLVTLLKEYSLENSLPTLLSNVSHSIIKLNLDCRVLEY